MSWFVFTESELVEIGESPHGQFADEFRENGSWTEDDTLLVKVSGPQATVLVACYDKHPRRMAIDPPVDTRPSATKI